MKEKLGAGYGLPFYRFATCMLPTLALLRRAQLHPKV